MNRKICNGFLCICTIIWISIKLPLSISNFTCNQIGKFNCLCINSKSLHYNNVTSNPHSNYTRIQLSNETFSNLELFDLKLFSST